MKLRLLIVFTALLFSQQTFEQNNNLKSFKAVRITEPPKIDGILDPVWATCPSITGFTQKNPYFNQKPLDITDVRILYDDKAIYVSAFCKDEHPDSILKQLGNRDDDGLNADYFYIGFDTYNKQQDAYFFGVRASGVQFDKRKLDNSYNAVWQSEVAINDSGWVVEMKIPYSAIRFPNQEVQQWRFQCVRYIRRIRQENCLVLEPREANNILLYWPYLEGISNIDAPLRLSFTPYLSAGLKTEAQKGEKTDVSKLFGGGMDLKYGINESYTLDLTLLPDFTQVQSDDKYKNLSAYETVYEEQRPFFKESVDLFTKGGLFYSRRIGRLPRDFYNVSDMMDSSEKITKNPQQTQLINAFKISGRNSKGLAIGVLNAITSDMNAQVEDSISNSKRTVLTEPWANYNVFVIDKAFKGGSDLYLTNTNFLRDKNHYNSTVTATGLTLLNKSQTYQLSMEGGMSQFYYRGKNIEELPDNGYKSSLGFYKVNGNFKFGLSSSYMDKNFSANDIGVTQTKDYWNNNGYLNYNNYNPTKLFLSYGWNLSYEQNYQLTTMKTKISRSDLNLWATTKNYTSIWAGGFANFYNGYNYDEPRTDGYVFRIGLYRDVRLGISTDYRKPFALDLSTSYYTNSTYGSSDLYIEISPLVRLSNHFSFRYQLESDFIKSDVGFADMDSLNISPLFGKRNITSITNAIAGNYLFKNDLSLNLKFRYYWSQGEYTHIYNMEQNGFLTESSGGYVLDNYNYNYNALTVDLVFSWQFAPGSNMMLIWKNEIFSDSNKLYSSYFENLKYLNEYPTNNTFLLKVLYYLDYEYIFKKKA